MSEITKTEEAVAIYTCEGTFHKNAGANGKTTAHFSGVVFRIPASKSAAEARSLIRGTLFVEKVRKLLRKGDKQFEGFSGLRELYFTSIEGLPKTALPVSVMSDSHLENLVRNEEIPVTLSDYPSIQTRRDAVQRGHDLMVRLASLPLDGSSRSQAVEEFRKKEAALVKRMVDKEQLKRLNGFYDDDDEPSAEVVAAEKQESNAAIEELTGVSATPGKKANSKKSSAGGVAPKLDGI